MSSGLGKVRTGTHDTSTEGTLKGINSPLLVETMPGSRRDISSQFFHSLVPKAVLSCLLLPGLPSCAMGIAIVMKIQETGHIAD